MPGSEHISPVSSATNDPSAVAASLQTTDAADEAPEPAMSGREDLDSEGELLPTDEKNNDIAVEQPVSSEQGKALHCCELNSESLLFGHELYSSLVSVYGSQQCGC